MDEGICGVLIRQIHDALEKTANNQLREKGLTLSQVQILHMLSVSESGERSLKELEQLMSLSQATTAGIVQRLERKGFVKSRINAVDKRIKHAKMTFAGKNVLLETREQMVAAEQRILKGFTAGESVVLVDYLRKYAII